MGYGSNDRILPRVYPWWLILVCFAFGVFVTLVVTQARPQSEDSQNLWLTATGIFHDATATMQAVEYQQATQTQSARETQSADPIWLTATAIVPMMTGTGQAQENQTATYVVQARETFAATLLTGQATQQATIR